MPQVEALSKLERELATFERHRAELLGTAERKFVVIHRDDVVGVYDTQADAISEGYRRFGNVPFLVKQVLEIEVPQNFIQHVAI